MVGRREGGREGGRERVGGREGGEGEGGKGQREGGGRVEGGRGEKEGGGIGIGLCMSETVGNIQRKIFHKMLKINSCILHSIIHSKVTE